MSRFFLALLALLFTWPAFAQVELRVTGTPAANDCVKFVNPRTLTSAGGGCATSGSAAPSDATYITEIANGSLSGEFALGSLATGILKNTTTTGVPSIAVAGTDYAGIPTANTFTTTQTITPATEVSPLVLTGGTLAGTTSRPLISGTQTWNNSGLTATGLLFNFTDTSSNSASLLADIQVGGSSKLTLNKSGLLSLLSSTNQNAVQLTYTDAGASAGPGIQTTRLSASPAASDVLANIVFNGNDSAANVQQYGQVRMKVLDPVDTSEDSQYEFFYETAGTLAANFIVGSGGMQLGAATGATLGDGKINVSSGYFVNNVAVNPALTGTTGSIGGGALLAGACTSGTVAVTNSTTAMAVSASPVTYPGDGAYWMGYVSTAGTVTVKVCAAVALTPTASAYNVRVIQ